MQSELSRRFSRASFAGVYHAENLGPLIRFDLGIAPSRPTSITDARRYPAKDCDRYWDQQSRRNYKNQSAVRTTQEGRGVQGPLWTSERRATMSALRKVLTASPKEKRLRLA
jgi:hypothetical protein